MNTFEENLASGFDKIRKIDVLESVLADCTDGGIEVMTKKTKHTPILKYVAGIAAVLAVAFCAVSAIGSMKPMRRQLADTIEARVCLDVNPSIEIGVNINAMVLDVAADNEDGEKIIDGMDFKEADVCDTVSILKRLSAVWKL